MNLQTTPTTPHACCCSSNLSKEEKQLKVSKMPRCFLAKKSGGGSGSSSSSGCGASWSHSEEHELDENQSQDIPDSGQVTNRSTVGSILAAQAVQSIQEPIGLPPTMLPPPPFNFQPSTASSLSSSSSSVVSVAKLAPPPPSTLLNSSAVDCKPVSTVITASRQLTSLCMNKMTAAGGTAPGAAASAVITASPTCLAKLLPSPGTENSPNHLNSSTTIIAHGHETVVVKQEILGEEECKLEPPEEEEEQQQQQQQQQQGVEKGLDGGNVEASATLTATASSSSVVGTRKRRRNSGGGFASAETTTTTATAIISNCVTSVPTQRLHCLSGKSMIHSTSICRSISQFSHYLTNSKTSTNNLNRDILHSA